MGKTMKGPKRLRVVEHLVEGEEHSTMLGEPEELRAAAPSGLATQPASRPWSRRAAPWNDPRLARDQYSALDSARTQQALMTASSSVPSDMETALSQQASPRQTRSRPGAQPMRS